MEINTNKGMFGSYYEILLDMDQKNYNTIAIINYDCDIPNINIFSIDEIEKIVQDTEWPIGEEVSVIDEYGILNN